MQSPIALTTRRDCFDWLGDYFGVALNGGGVFLAFADNDSIPGAALSRVRVTRVAVR